MKKVFILFALCLILSSRCVFAIEVNSEMKRIYSGVTKDERVIEALELMRGTDGEFSRKAILGKNLTNLPVVIEFRDLGEIRSSARDYDALGMKSGSQLYIFLNKKHKNASPVALAAILSHEALHQDVYNSKNEETYAWTMEATVWHELKVKNPNAAKDVTPLVTRENTLEGKLINANFTNKNIRDLIESHSAYSDLPHSSPGFEYVE